MLKKFSNDLSKKILLLILLYFSSKDFWNVSLFKVKL